MLAYVPAMFLDFTSTKILRVANSSLTEAVAGTAITLVLRISASLIVEDRLVGPVSVPVD